MFVFYFLFFKFCVLRFVFCVLCFMFCILYFAFRVLRFVFCVSRVVCCVLFCFVRLVSRVLCLLHWVSPPQFSVSISNDNVYLGRRNKICVHGFWNFLGHKTSQNFDLFFTYQASQILIYF